MTTYLRLFDASDEQWGEMLHDGSKWEQVENTVTYVDDRGEQTVEAVFLRLEDDTYWRGCYFIPRGGGYIYDAAMCEVEPYQIIRTCYRRKVYEGGAPD